MKRIITIIAAFIVSSCASGPAPNFVNGKYYLGGDKDCKRYTVEYENTVTCYNSKGVVTGIRTPMDGNDMANYAAQQQRSAQDSAALNQQLQQTSDTFYKAAEQFKNSTYTPPPAQSYGQTPTVTNCVSTGSYLSCKSPLSENSFTCTKTGEYYFCRQK